MTLPGQSSQSDALRKVLLLERARGYKDDAVLGGLDLFLRRWFDEIKSRTEDKGHGLLGSGLLGSSYASKGLAERRSWVEAVLSLVTGKTVQEIAPASQNPTQSRPRLAPKGSRATEERSLDVPLTVTKGISPAVLSRLGKLGVSTIRDLLFFFPHRYDDFSRINPISKLTVGKDQTVIGAVWEARVRTYSRGRKAVEAVIGDETGNVRAIWFNQVYLTKILKTNTKVVLSGAVEVFRGTLVMESPEYEILNPGEELLHTGRLVPVYPLTAGLSAKAVRRVVKNVLDSYASSLKEHLPESIRSRIRLLPLPGAVREVHFPSEVRAAEEARRRLAFDELFTIQMGVISRKKQWQGEPGHPLDMDHRVLEATLRALPYSLTGAQKKALAQILDDLKRPVPMSRLLQGDVGSGKTVVAALALLVAAANGYQGVLMAPTEILAEQHFKTLQGFFRLFASPVWESTFFNSYALSYRSAPLGMGLLIGSLPAREKNDIQRRLAQGGVDIVVGTHALIQGGVSFDKLGLVVVDEQHRFGVMQRAALLGKGTRPHLLAMTATPIPRTLSLTIYGDLDISVLDELPPGRPRVRTRWLSPEKRQVAYAFLRKQVQEGRQVFVICPLIEGSEALEAKAATEEFERLSQEIFTDLRMGLLHGRMPMQEKDEVMRQFRDGQLDILVSTPVVEVGIDIPNATVMLVEGADRFGLSQLHQLRGRIGRGQHESYCMLLADDPSPEAAQRLSILEKTHDGFVIAEEDLRLRGPGEFFGTRQSGFPDLRMARLTDVSLLELARKEAEALLEKDSSLSLPEHSLLAAEVRRFWSRHEMPFAEA